jgi:CRISPR/Cas system Type II protein with McrA/HNH and RuvC-like nuclease domain
MLNLLYGTPGKSMVVHSEEEKKKRVELKLKLGGGKLKGPTPIARVRLYEEQNGLCFYCGRKTEFRFFTVDHKHPRCRGGGNRPKNTVGACTTCNNAKSAMTVEEFLGTDYLSDERRVLLGAQETPKRKFSEYQRDHCRRITALRP